MLRSVTVGAKCAVAVVGFIFLLAGACISEPVSAANTQINTTLCSGTSSNAVMIIESPTSDSIIDVLPLEIKGEVQNITQIDIMVNGGYNSTLSVSANQTTFLTSLQLPEGTHTITLVANDVCQFSNVTESLVITYHPKVTPSTGGDTPTETPGTAPPSIPRGGGSVSGDPLGSNEGFWQRVPIIGGLVPVAMEIGTALDFDSTARKGGIITAMIRFALFVTGLVLFIFGGVLIRRRVRKTLSQEAVQAYIQDSGRVSDPNIAAHMSRNIVIVRSSGALLLLLAFWI